MTGRKIFLVTFLCYLLLLTAVALYLDNTGKTRIDFDLALHQTQETAKGEFFFDTGDGFREKETIKFYYHQDANNQYKHHSIYLPTRKKIKRLRFDPLQERGVVTIKNIVVQKLDNPLLHFSPIKSVPVAGKGIRTINTFVNGLSIYMDKDDPHLILLNNLESYTANKTNWSWSDFGYFSFPRIILLVLASCLLAFASCFVIANCKNISEVRPQRFYFFAAFFFGSMLVFLNPPFQVPDESSHYYRSYQLSDFKIKAEKRSVTELGGFLPEAVTMMPSRVDQFFQQWGHVMTLSVIEKSLDIPLDPDKKLFMPFANTTIYSPVSYLPQTAGVLLARFFDMSALQLMYMGRFFNLLSWMVVISVAIKIIPSAKWLLVLLALLPMSIYEASSLSADAVTNSLAFLMIALTVRFKYLKRLLYSKEKVLYFFLCVLLMLSKFAYLPMVLLIFLIQGEKFGSKSKFWIFFLLLLSSCTVTIFSWLWFISDIHVAFSPDNCADPFAQLTFILQKPYQYFQVLCNTLMQNGMDLFFRQYVGVLASLTLFLPEWIYPLTFLILFFTAFFADQENFTLFWQDRVILLAVLFITIFLAFTMVYLNFNAPENSTIVGLQGRYMIPLGPLFFLVFRSRKVLQSSTGYQLWLMSYACGVLMVTVWIICDRYYLF